MLRAPKVNNPSVRGSPIRTRNLCNSDTKHPKSFAPTPRGPERLSGGVLGRRGRSPRKLTRKIDTKAPQRFWRGKFILLFALSLIHSFPLPRIFDKCVLGARGAGAGCCLLIWWQGSLLFIYVSSGLTAFADSSLDLWMGNTSSPLNNWG